MAIKIDAGDDVKRADYFFVDPNQIIVKEELRGRHTPPTEQEILNMAVSISTHGQRQPVECRRTADSKLLLTLGFTRTAAVRLIRAGFDYVDPNDGTTKHVHDPEMKLKVVLSDANDQTAFINNIVENAHRNNTSPIDDAFNQKKLRESYGLSDAEITTLYQYTDLTKVGRLRKLLGLSNPIQLLIHRGDMSVQAGLDLLDLPEDKQQEAVAAATTAKGTVKGSEVRSIVRDHILNDDSRPAQPASTGKNRKRRGGNEPAAKPRSMRELRLFLKAVADNDAAKIGGGVSASTTIDDAHGVFAKHMLQFLAGRRGNKALLSALDEHLDSERK